MSDMPEKIHMQSRDECGYELDKNWNPVGEVTPVRSYDDDIEYIRADLVPQWQQLRTAPVDKLVDILVLSRENEHYSKRVTNVYHNGKDWIGVDLYPSEYVSHWMPLPEPPGDIK